MSVTVDGVNFGTAPITLPYVQVARLLGRGDVFADTYNNTGPACGIVHNNDGSVTFLRDGAYVIYHCKSTNETQSRGSLRLAQYLCGSLGIVLLYFAINMDRANQSVAAGVKDFLINFASDILAVASILVAAEAVEAFRGRGGRNRAAGGSGGGGMGFPRDWGSVEDGRPFNDGGKSVVDDSVTGIPPKVVRGVAMANSGGASAGGYYGIGVAQAREPQSRKTNARPTSLGASSSRSLGTLPNVTTANASQPQGGHETDGSGTDQYRTIYNSPLTLGAGLDE